jgi:uncharacterized membrane protein
MTEWSSVWDILIFAYNFTMYYLFYVRYLYWMPTVPLVKWKRNSKDVKQEYFPNNTEESQKIQRLLPSLLVVVIPCEVQIDNQ